MAKEGAGALEVREKMNRLQRMQEKHKWIPTAALWGLVGICTLLLVSLCFDEGIDLDEAYSYRTVHGNTLRGIWAAILSANDTDIPLWYSALRVWTWIFGESWLSYKLFSVLGSFCTMALGATAVKRLWGFRTAALFIIPAGLAPALLHVGVNVRMYSWTVFLITACGITAYCLVRQPARKLLWTALFLLTVTGLFVHYFTAFCYLFIYTYLLLELWRKEKKSLWKAFACGGGALAPFCVWLAASDFFHLKDQAEQPLNFSAVNFEEFIHFIFHTNIEFSVQMGIGIWAAALLAILFLRKRFERDSWGFGVLCLLLLPVSYTIAAFLASTSSHFFVTRHIMHGLGLLWLGIALILSRVNLPVYMCALVFTSIMGLSSYRICYAAEYATTPYMEETKEFIAENMESGDIVIYNSEPGFDLLYGCYMPEQSFIYYPQLEDIQKLAGRRVWFFLCKPDFFPEEVLQEYGITAENMGHYGFQIINDCTDFDLLRLEIRGKEEGQ